MSSSPAVAKPHPALAVRLTLTLGLIMLAVGALFSAIYFVLSVSLFSRLATQQLEQKAKSAEVIVRAVALSRDTINTMTYIRNLQNGGFTDAIGVFNDKGHLVTAPATSPENKFTTPDGQHAAVSMASSAVGGRGRHSLQRVANSRTQLRRAVPFPEVCPGWAPLCGAPHGSALPRPCPASLWASTSG